MPSFDPVAYLNKPRWRSMSLGLGRIAELLEKLGNPQNSLRFIHVAGTNGKGSTSAFLAQIMQEAGYKVGLFTSPYLITFEERIQINGEVISRDDLVQVTLQVCNIAEDMAEHPTEFELMTAVAFLYFATKKCDIVVAEVGLGGRLDSTNIISRVEVSVITPIALDHCAVLGSTIAEIAQEKAGIIKPNVPVVSAPQTKEAKMVLEKVARSNNASIVFADGAIRGDNGCFSYKTFEKLTISLLGRYQRSNAVLALEAVRCLQEKGWNISRKALYRGLANTKWPGRFEIVSKKPCIIVDGSHNEQGVVALLETLAYRYPNCPVVFVVGILEDKEHKKMLELLLGSACAFVAIPVDNPRALSASDLAHEAQMVATCQKRKVEIYESTSVTEGIEKAVALVCEGGVICACGSLYSVANIKRAVEKLRLKGSLL